MKSFLRNAFEYGERPLAYAVRNASSRSDRMLCIVMLVAYHGMPRWRTRPARGDTNKIRYITWGGSRGWEPTWVGLY